MSQREILTNGSAFKRTDGRWCGVVWYKDEHGELVAGVQVPGGGADYLRQSRVNR